MSLSTVILSAVAALLAVLYLRPVFRFLKSLLHMKRVTKDLPSPPSVPGLGHLLTFAGDPDDLYDKAYQMSLDYGPTFTLWLGTNLILVIQDPDDIEHVMTSPSLSDKPHLYQFFEDFAGKAMLTMNGKDHRRRRKAISPFLHFDVLQEFVPSFDEGGRKMADKLCALADSGEVFDPKALCARCVNTSMCKTVFSLDTSDDRVDRERFIKYVDGAQDLAMYRVWNPWFSNDWLFKFSNHYKHYMKTIEVLDDFVKTVIGIKIAEKEKQVIENTPPKRRKTFVEHLISSTEEAVLEKEELYQESRLFSVVVSSSSRDLLNFCCVILAILPDVQLKLQEEIDAVFGGDIDRPVLPSDLPHLHYTERFVKETLRYFTIVPFFARACNEDVNLPSGCVAPKGCNIAFFMPAVHHNPKYFPDPSKFDPDRFLPENSRGRHPFCYLPFSGGVRNCVGFRYALMLQKTVLANLVRRVKFLPAPNTPKRLQDIPLKMGIDLHIRRDGDIRVERRFPAVAAR